MHPEALTIPQLLKRRLARDAQKIAVVGDEKRVTYAQLDERSAAIAAFMHNAGIVKSDRVGLLLDNGVDWAALAVAVMRMGAVLVPLSTFLRPPEFLRAIRTADVTHLFLMDGFRGNDYLGGLVEVLPGFDRNNENLRSSSAPSLKRIWRWSHLKIGSENRTIVDALGDRVAPGDDMAILFTSGSSGAPKGVIHTHGNGLRAVAASIDVRCLTPDDRLYLPMPLFWTGGFASGLLSVLSIGATLLTESIPEERRTIQFLVRERVTLFRGWPNQAERLAAHPDFAKADLSSLRPGSLDAVMPKALKAASPKARASLFGMTETFGPYCGAPLDQDMPSSKWGSCGRVVDGIEVRIVDVDTGRPVQTGETGVITLRGPNIMRGICGRSHDEVFDHDGFFATGDLGYMDGDGYMFYVGRKDDMFKVKGATVYPGEVEEALLQIPNVLRAFVADVAGGDGERLVAAAVVGKGGTPPIPEELARGLRATLSAFKVPTRWLCVSAMEEIPMLPTGKVDKVRLRQILGLAPNQ